MSTSTTVGIVSTLLVICGLFYCVRCEDEYFITGNRRALTKVVKEGSEVTECYIFADSAVIEYVLNATQVSPAEITRKEFKKLRRECRPIQERVIPNRMRKEKNNLRAVGRRLQEKNINENRRKRQKEAGERKRKQGRPDRGGGNGRGGGGRGSGPDKGNRRVKRGLEVGFELLYGIYPGTLWCGAGNLADEVETDDGFGELKELDACCKEHDHCPTSINGFSSKFGLFNYSPITCSHISCDSAFQTCLKPAAATNPDADLVGDLFFNILSIDCIRQNYPWECVEYDWFGLFCLTYERDTQAEKIYEFYDGLTYEPL